MKNLHWKIAGLLAVLLLTGCSVFGYRNMQMKVSVVNDNNSILCVEGTVDLPDGMPVRFLLSENEQTIAQGNAELHKGHFFDTLDISRAPGNSPLTLETIIEPADGSEEVQAITGVYGEKMLGKQVVELPDGSFRLQDNLRIVLPMSRRESAIRRVKHGDYALGLANLEGVIEADPNDREACAWLALALLQHSQAERQLGSRAHDLLKTAHVEELREPLRSECKVWYDKWEAEIARNKEEQERRAAVAKTLQRMEEAKDVLIPGQEMAGVKIGASDDEVYKLKIPDQYPHWNDEGVKYHMDDRDVDVFFDGKTHKVVEIYTTSTRFELKNGVRVGGDLYDAQQAFPDGKLHLGEVFPKTGYTVQIGDFQCPSGLVFAVRRTSRSDGTPINDVITGISVIAPFAWN